MKETNKLVILFLHIYAEMSKNDGSVEKLV